MNITQIAETISKHQFQNAYEHFSEDITWKLIGGNDLEGKAAVIKACEESAKYLSTVKTIFTNFKTFSGADFVIIESAAEYADDKNEKSAVASCDVYEFSENKLVRITSYNIELTK